MEKDGMTGFPIGPKHVGDGAPALIVAEVAQAHEGSLSLAHAYIDAIADAGADAVKWQHHDPDHECAPDEPWRVEPRWPQDNTRADYWRRTAFTPDQWWSIQAHAEARGLIFLASPFSVESVRLLNPLVPAWKIASGEVTHRSVLYAVAQTRKPVIVSTGLCTIVELDAALTLLEGREIPYAVLQCTSEYPCPAERVGLNIAQRYDGLSDHSGSIWPSVAAVALGAKIVEVHVKLSEHDQGFDAASSITVADLSRMVEGIRFVERALTPIDKQESVRSLQPMRDLFMGKHQRKAAYDARAVAAR